MPDLILVEELFRLLSALPPSVRLRAFRDLQPHVIRPPLLTARTDIKPTVRARMV